ncbi:hypothetical protein M992_0821 [Moellerella wisconsensis ATCC 35017]|uniref:Uncharacterized protein n=1 Tax=Moellerella wisconsensis ATCC 35017 TaxID=1354267 RepID=A0A0N0ZB40_9GAMM|nr:hypothetical protein M992_0821 [Moellerella wisconsensis ATCC 35017]
MLNYSKAIISRYFSNGKGVSDIYLSELTHILNSDSFG